MFVANSTFLPDRQKHHGTHHTELDQQGERERTDDDIQVIVIITIGFITYKTNRISLTLEMPKYETRFIYM